MAKINNIKKLRELIDTGYINMIKHPVFDIYILNYSPKTQIEKVWNEVTEQCRGVIVDSDFNIVSRPFNKFFNYEELIEMGREIPDLPFEVYEKLDGSLGIMYWGTDGLPYISTRGSFNSDQAKHATNVLHTRYADKFHLLDKNKTYCFEIIYPDDLHVVSYPDVDDIFLIGVFDNETGNEDNINDWTHVFNTTKMYDGITDYKTIREQFSGENKEGFVIRFSNGFRMKLKFAEYWKLHFLKAGFIPKNIFKYIVTGDNESIAGAMEMFDEEHRIYYNNIINGFYAERDAIIEIVNKEYRDNFTSQKEAAEYFKTCTYPAIMFAKYNNRDNVDDIIWGTCPSASISTVEITRLRKLKNNN
jgi:RNA ligase